jgi:hypothetical protein
MFYKGLAAYETLEGWFFGQQPTAVAFRRGFRARSRIHERTISLRFLGIILRVLEVSVWIF